MWDYGAGQHNRMLAWAWWLVLRMPRALLQDCQPRAVISDLLLPFQLRQDQSILEKMKTTDLGSF